MKEKLKKCYVTNVIYFIKNIIKYLMYDQNKKTPKIITFHGMDSYSKYVRGEINEYEYSKSKSGYTVENI